MGQIDNSADRRRRWLLVAVILVAVLLRVMWISDMEYKSDEKTIVRYVWSLPYSSFTPLGPVSEHAGFAHSSGFYYLVGLFTDVAREPLAVVAAVVAINCAMLGLALWVAYRQRPMLYALAMCATHITCVVYSRKIWPADLFLPWICVGLALLSSGLMLRSGPRRAATLAAAALCLVLAMHMYLGAGVTALVVGGYLFFWLLRTGHPRDAIAWVTGLAMGCMSFLPWAIAILTQVPGSHGPSTMAASWSTSQIPPLVKTALTLPTPIHFYDMYLKPIAETLNRRQSSGDFQMTRTLIDLATAFGILCFWLAIASVVAAWRRASRDPVLVAGLLALVLNGPIIFAGRVGNYMHYWLGVVPLAFYVMGWSITGAPLRRWAKLQRGLAIGFCVTSALASVSFLNLVHVNEGLPGEYGSAYSASNAGVKSKR